MLKSCASLFVCFLLCVNIQAQTEMAVEVIQPQAICVNSVTAWNGTTRRVIPIKLPENTIRWYYSFSASRNKEDINIVTSTFNLFAKISFLLDQTGTTATAISVLGRPPGTDYCDVFLLSSGNDVTSFENKLSFSYNRQGSREGFVSGVVDVTDRRLSSGWQYIGLRNNDFNDAVNVLIQVVAIVKLEPKTNGWTAVQRQQLYDSLKLDMSNTLDSSLNSDQINDICSCLTDRITTTYKPEDLSMYAKYELGAIFKKLTMTCIDEVIK